MAQRKPARVRAPKPTRTHPTHSAFVGQEPARPRRYLRIFDSRQGHRYLLAGIPNDLWRTVVDRADAEDVSIRQVLMLALTRYARLGFPSSAWGEGRVPPRRPARFTPVTATPLLGARCLRCGHEWVPRIARPRVCPHCRSRRWDRAE
jgi:hypothetical protein